MRFKTQRRYYKAIGEAILCYGAPFLIKLPHWRFIREKLLQAQRLILLVITRAYRTTSYYGVYVVAEVPPIDLTLEARARRYYMKKGREAEAIDVKDLSDDRYQRATHGDDGLPTSPETRKYFPTVQSRLEKPWVLPNEYTVQAFTGHGDFKEYLHRRR